jgi:hypothetical protein
MYTKLKELIKPMKIIKSKTGRPTKYKKEFSEQVLKLCNLGATNEDIANFFNVAKSTVSMWMNKHKEFSDALKEGKSYFDNKVEMALAQRAMGYSHPEDKIFNDSGVPLIVPTTKHYPPDTTACIFWLKNRKPQQWRDKIEQERSGTMEIIVTRSR